MVAKILKRRRIARLAYRWTLRDLHGTHTESREGATLVTLLVPVGHTTEERAYLFGGLSRDIFSTLVCLRPEMDPEQSKTRCEWKTVHQGSEQLKRFGHAACAWEGKLIVVGGARKYLAKYKKRDCLDDAFVFDPRREEWSALRWKGGFYARRYHTVCVVGKHLVVLGGIDCLEKYQRDVLALNLSVKGGKEHQWFAVSTAGPSPGGIANHTSVLVLSQETMKDVGNYGVYSLPRPKQASRIECEGIYVFGGRDEKGARNSLHVLKLGQRPCEWIKPDVDGEPPMPRYGHSANFFPKRNYMVVFGGRNDSSGYLNDLWLLELERLCWIRWDNRDCVPSIPEGRYTHCAAVMGNSLFVFGGLGEGNYCRGDVYSFDFVDTERPNNGIAQKPSPLEGNTVDICGGNLTERYKDPPEEEDVSLPMITQQHSVGLLRSAGKGRDIMEQFSATVAEPAREAVKGKYSGMKRSIPPA